MKTEELNLQLLDRHFYTFSWEREDSFVNVSLQPRGKVSKPQLAAQWVMNPVLYPPRKLQVPLTCKNTPLQIHIMIWTKW